MDEAESLSHSKRECKYRVVFIPKCRRRILCEQLRRHLGEGFHELGWQSGWLPANVKLSLSPRHTRGISHYCLIE